MRVYWLKKDLEALGDKDRICCGRGKNPLNIFAVDGEIPGKLSILAQKSLNYTWTWKGWTGIHIVLSVFPHGQHIIWASFLVWNKRKVLCCSCRVWRKINTFPISNIKRRLKSLRHCTMHRLVLGLTSGATCFVWDSYSLPWGLLWLSFRWNEYLSWRCLWYGLEISLLEYFFWQTWEVSGSFERLVCLVVPLW